MRLFFEKKISPSIFLEFSDRMDVEKSQRVPPFQFFRHCETFFQNFFSPKLYYCQFLLRKLPKEIRRFRVILRSGKLLPNSVLEKCNRRMRKIVEIREKRGNNAEKLIFFYIKFLFFVTDIKNWETENAVSSSNLSQLTIAGP